MHLHEVMTAMIVDEKPPSDNASHELRVEAANDNGPGPVGSIDARILVVARAIGRLLAREQMIQSLAANGNDLDDAQENTE